MYFGTWFAKEGTKVSLVVNNRVIIQRTGIAKAVPGVGFTK